MKWVGNEADFPGSTRSALGCWEVFGESCLVESAGGNSILWGGHQGGLSPQGPQDGGAGCLQCGESKLAPGTQSLSLRVQAVSGARAFLGDKGCLRAPAVSGVIGWVRGHRLCAEAQGFSRNMGLLGVQAGLGTQKCLGSHAVLGA